jgi:ketosteroid isomerase-like protein
MSQTNLATAREAVRLFSESDMEALGRLYADDAVLIGPEGWPEPGPFEGREAVIGQFARLREDWVKHRMTIQREVASDEWAVTELRWTAEGIASGAQLDMTVAGAYRVRQDGVVVEARFYWTWEEAVAAAGLDA